MRRAQFQMHGGILSVQQIRSINITSSDREKAGDIDPFRRKVEDPGYTVRGMLPLIGLFFANESSERDCRGCQTCDFVCNSGKSEYKGYTALFMANLGDYDGW